MEHLPEDKDAINIPLHVISDKKNTAVNLYVGANPTFFLKKNDSLEYLIINGNLVDLKKPEQDFSNALIYK